MAEQNPAAPPAAAGQPKIIQQIVITLDERGQLLVNGNIENMLTTFGLLEMAKIAIQKMQIEAEKRIQLAPAGLAGHFKTGN